VGILDIYVQTAYLCAFWARSCQIYPMSVIVHQANLAFVFISNAEAVKRAACPTRAPHLISADSCGADFIGSMRTEQEVRRVEKADEKRGMWVASTGYRLQAFDQSYSIFN